MPVKKRAAVLVSGGGSNLQAIIDAAARGELPHVALTLVVSSEPDAFALERARRAGIPCRILERRGFCGRGVFDRAAYSAALAGLFAEYRVEAAALAGFTVILGEPLLSAYRGRLINVHPSLIPAFCGDGFFGLRVHEAALRRGVKVSGATVHLVDGVTDGGPILAQKAVPVRAGDTPETLRRRVMRDAEWLILPAALESLCARPPAPDVP